MNVAGRRAPVGRPKILTHEDFEKAQQKPKTSSPSPSPSTTTSTSTAPSSKKKSKKKRGPKKQTTKGLKLAVRLLPPNLPAEEFWSKVSEFIAPEHVLEKYYIQGKYSNKPFKLPTYSRAYIQFKDSKKVDEFVANFKDTTFEDDKESMVPQFALSLFDKLPDSTREYVKPKQSLEDMLSYKTFIKFFNGEIERPKSFLINEGSSGAKKEKIEKMEKVEKEVKKDKKDKKQKDDGKKKGDGKKTDDGKKKDKVNKKKKDEKRSDKSTDGKNAAAAAAGDGDAKKSDKPKRQRKPKSKEQKDKNESTKSEQKKDTKPKDSKPKDSKPKKEQKRDPKPKSDEPQQQAPRPKGKLMTRDNNTSSSSDAKPKPKPMLLKRTD